MTNRLQAELRYWKERAQLLEQSATFASPQDLARFAPPIPWLYYELKHELFINQNSLGKMFEIQPVNFTSLTESAKRETYQRLLRFFNEVPERFVVQFHEVHNTDFGAVYQRKKAQIQTYQQKARKTGQPHWNHLHLHSEDQLNDLQKRQETGENASKMIRHFMTVYQLYPFRFPNKKQQLFLDRFLTMLPSIGGKNGQQSLSQFYLDFNKSCEKLLRWLKLPFRKVSEMEFIHLMRGYFYYDHPNAPIYEQDTSSPITRQFIPKDLFYDLGGFCFGALPEEAPHSVITSRRTEAMGVRMYSPKIVMGCHSVLTEIPYNFTVTTSFYHDPQIKAATNKIALNSMNIRAQDLGSPEGKEQFHQQRYIFDEKMGKEQQSAFRSSCTVIYSGTQGENEKVREALLECFQEPPLECNVSVDQQFGPCSYLGALPFGYTHHWSVPGGLDVPILAESARSIIPIMGNHPRFGRENEMEGLLFSTEEGKLVHPNPYHFKAPAKHLLVIGYTGSGKSTLLNYWLDFFLNHGGCAFVIDPGSSMKQTIVSHGGEFHEITTQNPLQVNIFRGKLRPIDPETKEPSHAKLSMILNFLLVMAYGLETHRMSPDDVGISRSILQEAVEDAYAEIEPKANVVGFSTEAGEERGGFRVREVTLSLVRDKIIPNQSDFPDVSKKLHKLLGPYCQGGQYGHFFDGDFPGLENTIMGVDIKGIKEDPVLLNLVVMLFMGHARETFQWRKSQGKTELSPIIFDEARNFTKGNVSPEMGKFMIELALEIRKYNGVLCAASQSLSHFTEQPNQPNPVGEAILNSCPHWILMYQDDYFLNFSSDSKRRISELNQTAKQRIMSFQTVKDLGYSQFYFYSVSSISECGFLTFRPTPLMLMKYSVDPQDTAWRIRASQQLKDKVFKNESEKTLAVLKRALQLKQEAEASASSPQD